MSHAKTTMTADVISEYRLWKQQGEELRTQAKQAMEARFRELLAQAVQIARDYRNDFGVPLKPPPGITSFRYKSGARPKGAKAAAKPAPAVKATKPAKPEPAVEPPPAKPSRKVAGLEKRLDTARHKLEQAKTAGAPTKNLEDRIYEIEDDLRLARA